MPERHFDLHWPDGSTRSYYSPSTTISEHFSAGKTYTVPDFVQRARAAMHAAAERVRAKYGYYCSSAMDTLQQIEQTAAGFPEQAAEVRVVDIR